MIHIVRGGLAVGSPLMSICLQNDEDVAILRELVSRAVNTWSDPPEMVDKIYDFLHQVPERFVRKEA